MRRIRHDHVVVDTVELQGITVVQSAVRGTVDGAVQPMRPGVAHDGTRPLVEGVVNDKSFLRHDRRCQEEDEDRQPGPVAATGRTSWCHNRCLRGNGLHGIAPELKGSLGSQKCDHCRLSYRCREGQILSTRIVRGSCVSVSIAASWDRQQLPETASTRSHDRSLRWRRCCI